MLLLNYGPHCALPGYHETNYNDSSMLIGNIPQNDDPKSRRHFYKDVLSRVC